MSALFSSAVEADKVVKTFARQYVKLWNSDGARCSSELTSVSFLFHVNYLEVEAVTV